MFNYFSGLDSGFSCSLIMTLKLYHRIILPIFLTQALNILAYQPCYRGDTNTDNPALKTIDKVGPQTKANPKGSKDSPWCW